MKPALPVKGDVDITVPQHPHICSGFRILVGLIRRVGKTYVLAVALIGSPDVIHATGSNAIWSRDRVLLAADSKITTPIPPMKPDTCKLFQFGELFVTFAGKGAILDTDYNLITLIDEIFNGTGDPKRKMGLLIERAIEQLSRATIQIAPLLTTKEQREQYYVPVEIFVAGEVAGKLSLFVIDIHVEEEKGVYLDKAGSIYYDELASNMPIALRAIGQREAVQKYVAAHPNWTTERDLAASAEQFVRLEIDDKPDLVGPPISVLEIRPGGEHTWIKPGMCEEKK